MGYHFDEEAAKQSGFGGQNLGFDKYASFQMKILHQNFPLLKELRLRPFCFMNLALLPNLNVAKDDIELMSWKQSMKNHLRSSFGVGISMQLSFVAIESYFNLKVNHQKNEIKNGF